MTFFNIDFLLVIGAIIAVLSGIPAYLWIGNKIGKRVFAFMGAVIHLLLKRKRSFWISYDLWKDDWTFEKKILWPFFLVILTIFTVVITAVLIIIQFSKFWSQLVKKCWR